MHLRQMQKSSTYDDSQGFYIFSLHEENVCSVFYTFSYSSIAHLIKTLLCSRNQEPLKIDMSNLKEQCAQLWSFLTWCWLVENQQMFETFLIFEHQKSLAIS